MAQRRPFAFTTPDHPFTLGVSFVLVYLGLITLLGFQDPISIREPYGDTVVTLWGLARMSMGLAAGFGAVLAARAMRTGRSPGFALLAEWIGCLVIVTAQGFYLHALLASYGPLSTMETQGLTAMTIIVALWRLLQIPWQWHRYRRSGRRGHTTETLADARS